MTEIANKEDRRLAAQWLEGGNLDRDDETDLSAQFAAVRAPLEARIAELKADLLVMAAHDPEFIDLETASARYGLSPRQLRRLIVGGRLPASKLMVRPEDVRRLLEPAIRTRPAGVRRGEAVDEEK